MKTLGRTWFSQMCAPTVIGVVLVEFSKKECQAYDIDKGNRAAYLGMGVFGNTEKQDVKHVVLTGAKFPVKIAEQLLDVK